MDSHNEYNYVLTIVDALTRFVKFLPCTRNITGEETLKLILREWIMHYDKPSTIMSDNDVRFSQHQGFIRKFSDHSELMSSFQCQDIHSRMDCAKGQTVHFCRT